MSYAQLKLLTVFLLFTVVVPSCKNADEEKTRQLLNEIIFTNSHSDLPSKCPEIIEDLLLIGAYIPTDLPANFDTTSSTFALYNAWSAVEEHKPLSSITHVTEIQHYKKQSNLNSKLSSLALTQIIDQKINKEAIDLLQNLSLSELCLIEQYAFLQLLYATAKVFHSQYNLQNALATIYYGLHMIEKSADNRLFILIENQLWELYANIVMNESPQFSSILPIAIDILKENYQLLNNQDMISYLDMLYIEENILNLDQIMNLKLGEFHKEKLITHLGFLEIERNPEKALYLFSKSLNLITYDSYRKKVLHIYKAYCYLSLEDYTGAAAELVKAEDYLQLHVSDQKDITFLVKRLEIELASKTNSCSSLFEKNLSLREAAKDAFTGYKSLHLEDFYSQNCIEILTILQSCDTDLQQYSTDIINLFYESKILTENNLFGIDFTANYAGNSAMIKISSFENFRGLQDPVYKEIFHMSMEAYVETYLKDRGLLPLSSEITTTDSVIVNSIAHSNQYGIYCKSADSLKLYLLDRPRIDSLISILFDKITSNRVQEEIIAKIAGEFSFIINLPNKNTIHLIPDGQLSLLPFEVIFPDKKFIYLKSIDQLALSDSHISSKNGTVYTFSDATTLSDKSLKQVPELPQALNEAVFIQRATNSNMVNGKKLTKKRFLKKLHSSFIHVATHGKSSKDNRLDNFLLLRKQAQLDTIYAFEIANSTDFPHVAIFSSCSTGTGEFQIGSGTFSIANALRKSGTSHIVKTVWPVDDHSSQEFMETMYSYWTSNHSLYESIKFTKEAFKEENRPTVDWAGYILEGLGNVRLY